MTTVLIFFIGICFGVTFVGAVILAAYQDSKKKDYEP